MREQVPSKLTPEQGWAKMKPILDREMPVEKRSRRFLLFWWTTAVVALLGVSGLVTWYTMGESSTPAMKDNPAQAAPHQPTLPQEANPGFSDNTAPETDHKPVSEMGSESKADLSSVNPIAEHDQSTQASTSTHGKLTLREKPSRVTTAKKPGQLSSNYYPDINQTEAATIAVQQPTTLSDQNIKSSIITSSTPTRTSPGDMNVENTNVAMVTTTRNGQVISPLPWMGFIDVIRMGDANSISFVPRITDHNSRISDDGSRFALHPFATANALAGFHGGGGGYIGAGMDVDIVSRLDVNLGFGYRSYDPQLSFLPKASRLDAVNNADLGAILQNDNNYPGIPEYIASESFSSSSSYLALNSIVETLHQWQLNLGVTYSFAKRFYAEGGLAWDFGTKAKSQYPIISVDGALPTSNVRVSHSLDEYHLVRKSMTSWYGGLGYHFGRHFDVYGQVVFSFQPYLLTTDYSSLVTSGGEREDYINGLTLGVRYKL